jgi:hypothetical protein
MDKPQHMACLKVDDHGGISVPAVKLERICAQIARLSLGLSESGLAVFIPSRVEPREPRPVDLFHHVPVEPCHEGHFLERLTQGRQVTHECEQQQRDALAWALKGTSSMQVPPHSLHAHLGRKTSILALSIPRGRCQSMMGAFPFFSIVLPQQGQQGASDTAGLPGTVRICTAFRHLLVDVPNSLVRALSLGFPVCTKPSRWEGIRKKTESSPAWEMAGSWAAVDATLVSALHPPSESTCCDARF